MTVKKAELYENMFVVFDLDGTLADHRHRLHFLDVPKRQFDAYHERCIDDTPIIPTLIQFKLLQAANHHIEIWTGRSDKWRPESELWLRNVCDIDHSHLVNMRKHNNPTPDFELKEQWLKSCERKPDLVFEDRSRVVEMWRDNGVQCYQVDWGDF